MKKLVLIDGNNLMFRSYFATAYTGNIMKNSKGFPTNALYGFVSMINKIIAEENPSFLAVAFDIGKNFRKEKYDFYKEGRNATPEELKMQMPIARKILAGMGIKYLELAPYEADDIIGTLVKYAEKDRDFDATIISSDKDLLQLINFETDVKLLKKDTFIRYNEEKFKTEWGIDPIRIIDLKALMGDPSDNIPGVKGIGEKTALKLLQEYGSLTGIYENIDKIKGANHDKLLKDKENAFMSFEIATIYKEVPLNIDLDNLKYFGSNDSLIDIFKELEFTSFLKQIPAKNPTVDYLLNPSNLNLDSECALYLELDKENYYEANFLMAAITDKNGTYVFQKIDNLDKLLIGKKVITYDYKKDLSKINFQSNFDLMIAAYLLNLNIKDDIAFLMSIDGINVKSINEYLKENDASSLALEAALKSKYLFECKNKYLKLLNESEQIKLFQEIEMPLAKVLSEMEKSGFKCHKCTLDDMKIEIGKVIELTSKEIYELAGCEFNISSPKQLGEILFNKLGLAGAKKNKNGYKTDASVLNKLLNKHPIIEKILLYRNLTKLFSTYLEGLEPFIKENEMIHPIFKQTLARTGRLSCTEPNLQNIPTKAELGRTIRKAFVPKNDLLLSADYSQIELRILAHISNSSDLIKAFNNNEDIHSHVAADIYGIKDEDVTKIQRKTAKAVIFGIVYGISGFGLGENLHISPKEAKNFIDKYYELYPGVKLYMDNIIKEAKNQGYVKTLFGRKRIIDEINSSNFMLRQTGERMALNTPIQGTSADIIKLAMVNIFKKMQEKNLQSKMILQVHDELIFDVVETELKELKELVQTEMENVIKLNVPLKVEINVANNWYEI